MRLVVIAVHEEAAAIIGAGTLGEASVLVTGPGKVAASATVARHLARHPDVSEVLNLGTAGGLRADLAGLYEVSAVVEHDFPAEAIAALTGRHENPPLELEVSGRYPSLVCATGDRFVTDGSTLATVRGVAPGLVDMELYGVAWAAAAAGVTCRAVKFVSDFADSDAARSWKASVADAAKLLAQVLYD